MDDAPFWRTGYGQLAVASYISLSTIGVWNALNTIGGLGTGDLAIAHLSMTIMHGCSLVFGTFAGSAINHFGLRAAATFGSTWLAVFLTVVALYHFYEIPHGRVWLVLAALACGSSIGMQLAAVASATIHYALDAQRARFLAVNSVVLNLGGLAGSALSLGMSAANASTARARDAAVGLSRTNYFTLLAVLYTGLPASLLLAPSERVVRSDGAPAPAPARVSAKRELADMLRGLLEPYLWLMMPMFICSIYHEVSLFNYFNVEYFDVRSRAMNSIYYYLGRVMISFPFQLVCDACERLPDRILAATGFTAAICAVAFATASMALADVGHVRSGARFVDLTEARSSFFAVCFFAYGSLESIATSFSLWLIGSLPFGDTAMANRYVGLYRVGASVGGLVSWSLSSSGRVSDTVQWATGVGVWCTGLICVLVLQQRLRGPGGGADPGGVSPGGVSLAFKEGADLGGAAAAGPASGPAPGPAPGGSNNSAKV